MPIAHYTKEIMDQLQDTGVAVVKVRQLGGVPKEVARSRISNAARRLGLRVTTHYVAETNQGPVVIGEVIDRTSSTVAVGATYAERLARRGYYVREAVDGTKVYWIANDDPDNFDATPIGQWPTTEAAYNELHRYDWPHHPVTLDVRRKLDRPS